MQTQTIKNQEEHEFDNAAKAYRQALNKHFYVKKRALFRKGEQLAQFCNSQVFISIFNNETGKIFSFTSHDDFNLEKITQLVLRDVQYGASLNKNKKFLEENFEKIKTNLKQFQDFQKIPASLDNHFDGEHDIERNSQCDTKLQYMQKHNQASDSEFKQTATSTPESTMNILTDYLTIDDKVMIEYPPQLPKMNKVSSGLLAMNQAKAERYIHHLSKQSSVASHTATISNDVDHVDERDLQHGFDHQPPSLFQQDSIIPKTTKSHDTIVSTLVDSSYFPMEDF